MPNDRKRKSAPDNSEIQTPVQLFQTAVENYKELVRNGLHVKSYSNNADKIQFAIELEKRFWKTKRVRYTTELAKNLDEDDDPATHPKTKLSGCRAFSTSVMFEYLKSKGEYAGDLVTFSEIFNQFPANLISGYNNPRSSHYEYKSTTRFKPGLNMVQISSFQSGTSLTMLNTEHTFLVFNDNENGKFYLASSWDTGVIDFEVTEPELKKLTHDEYSQLNIFLSNLVAKPNFGLNFYVKLFFGEKNSLKFGSNKEKSFKVFVLHEYDFKVLFEQLPKNGGYRKKRKRKRKTKKKGKRNTFKKSKRIRKRSNK